MPASKTEQSAAAAGLCLACGLCCNGVLFNRARAQPDEFAAMNQVGLETGQGSREEGAFFKLPCHHLDGCRCTIYETRFRICRDFSCALLTGLQQGEVAQAEAQKVVADAKAMVDRVSALDPSLKFADARIQLQLKGPFAGAETPEARQAAGRVYVEMAALERYLDRHFRREGATMFSYDALGSAETAPDIA